MIVLVTGGRDFYDADRVARVLMAIHRQTEITTLVSGHARGADRLAENWARVNAIATDLYPVSSDDWDKYGKRAGIMRNIAMFDATKPDLVVAFPGGNGTAHMRGYAHGRGARIIDG